MGLGKIGFKKVTTIAVPTVAVVAGIAFALNACSPGGRTTEGRDDEYMSQAAAEAEAAEAQMAQESHGSSKDSHDSKSSGHGEESATKTAKAEKSEKSKKAEKAEKATKTAKAEKPAKAEKHEAKKEATHAVAHDSHAAPAKETAHKTVEHKQAEHKPAAAPKANRSVASARGGVYVVQVGAFKVKENAEKLTEKLKTAGFPVSMQSIEHSKNGLLHLVRFEPTTDRSKAETQIEDLSAKQSLKAIVMKEN